MLRAKRDILVGGHPSFLPLAQVAPSLAQAPTAPVLPWPQLLLTALSPVQGPCPCPGQAVAMPLLASRECAEPAALLLPALVASSDGAELSLQQAGCKDELFPSETMSAVPSWKIFIFFAWWLQENQALSMCCW